ncbi:helix-turn-helix domain-containing protein [Scytonema sp. PRP1]|uniref:helix-turn-helix domain-containing protein n=1 Tax=Scytonema sp. PRP1 TaxID=3120513 RepID=UPI002FCF0F58
MKDYGVGKIMPGFKADSVAITDIERKALIHIVATGNEHTSTKAKALLKAEAGETTAAISRELEVSLGSVVGWKKKWNSSTIKAKTWEEAIDKVEKILGTAAGRPKKCKQAQVSKIIEIVTWNNRDYRSRHAQNEIIASEAVRRGIVSDISPRSIGRLLEQYEKETAVSS